MKSKERTFVIGYLSLRLMQLKEGGKQFPVPTREDLIQSLPGLRAFWETEYSLLVEAPGRKAFWDGLLDRNEIRWSVYP